MDGRTPPGPHEPRREGAVRSGQAAPAPHAAVAERRVVDTLSLVLDDIRLSGAEMIDFTLIPAQTVSFARPDRAMIYIVTAGEAWLAYENEMPIAIRRADLVMVTTGRPHRLACTPDFSGAPGPDLGAAFAGSSALVATTPGSEPVPSARIDDPGDTGAGARVTCGVFRYDADFAEPLIAALPPTIRFSGTGADAPPWLVIGLAFLAQERSSPRPAQQAVINRLIDILLIECLRDQMDRLPPDAANWLAALQDPHVSLAIAAIHRDPARDWSVPDLASIANLSRSAFAARFSARLEQSPMAYVTFHRLRLAARQLRQEAVPIKTIAARLGYQSTVGFNQAFRRAFGTSPSAWRSARNG